MRPLKFFVHDVYIFYIICNVLKEMENKARLKERMRKKLGKKGMDASVFKDSQDAEEDEVDEASESGDRSPSCTTPILAASTSLLFTIPEAVCLSPTNTRQEESQAQEVQEVGVVGDQSETVPGDEDERLSVISQTSSKRSPGSTPNRKKRKITDSVTELEVLGGSVSPVPKRIRSNTPTVGVTPPRPSQQMAFPVFSPIGHSPSTRKKSKKRKSTGVMGF